MALNFADVKPTAKAAVPALLPAVAAAERTADLGTADAAMLDQISRNWLVNHTAIVPSGRVGEPLLSKGFVDRHAGRLGVMSYAPSLLLQRALLADTAPAPVATKKGDRVEVSNRSAPMPAAPMPRDLAARSMGVRVTPGRSTTPVAARKAETPAPVQSAPAPAPAPAVDLAALAATVAQIQAGVAALTAPTVQPVAKSRPVHTAKADAAPSRCSASPAVRITAKPVLTAKSDAPRDEFRLKAANGEELFGPGVRITAMRRVTP